MKKNLKRYIKRLISVVLLVVLSAAVFGVSAPLAFSAATSSKIDVSDAAIKKLEDQLKKIQSDKTALEKKISNAKDNLSDQLQYKTYLDTQLKLTQDDIDTTTALVVEYGNKIRDTEAEIARLETEVADNLEIVKERLRLSYEDGRLTYVQMVFNNDNFTDFLIAAERASSMVDYEVKLMQKLNGQAESLKLMRDELTVTKAENDALAASLDEKQAKLEKDAADNAKYITSLQYTKTLSEKQLKEAEKQEDELDKEIEALLVERQRQLNALYAGGTMIWPCDRKWTRISSWFGWRDFDKSYHRGLDIPLDYGEPVLAANAGTVVTAVQHPSYGYYVLIDHGGGIATLYAHNSKLLVSAGDKVTLGQQIAKAGSTGTSTGNHIHFEVRKNGVCVNPLDGYVTQPKS